MSKNHEKTMINTAFADKKKNLCVKIMTGERSIIKLYVYLIYLITRFT